MGNQNSARLIALEKSVKETSLSAGPSPKKFSTNTKDGIANGKQVESEYLHFRLVSKLDFQSGTK